MFRYFFDTYALLRLYRGEASYVPYAGIPIVTDSGCLYEFAREVFRRGNAREAQAALADIRAERISPTNDDLVEAAKLAQRLARISAQDALGYALARRAGLLFLTGDRAFRRLPAVEFVE